MKALAVLFWVAALACAVLAITQVDEMRAQARVAESALRCAELNRSALAARRFLEALPCAVPDPLPAITVWAGGFWAALLALLGALPWRLARQAAELHALRLRLGSLEGETWETQQRVRGLGADALAAADRVRRG